MEKLIVNFDRNPKGLNDRVRIVSLLERHGIGFEWEKIEEPQSNRCPKCGSTAYMNDNVTVNDNVTDNEKEKKASCCLLGAGRPRGNSKHSEKGA